MRFLALLALFVAVSVAYVIKPLSLSTVGMAKAGSRFWKPSRPIKLGEGVGAFRVSHSRDDCEDDCRFSAVVVNEDSADFDTYDFQHFCGSGGVFENSVLTCIGKALDHNDNVFSFSQLEYALVDKALSERASNAVASFDVGEFGDALSLRLDGDVLRFEEKRVFLRSGELSLTNGSAIHAFFKSSDGVYWNLTSVVPFPLGRESTLHRLGETKLMLIAGVPGNFTQGTSVFFGTRWEKIENVGYAAPLSTFVSKFHTTIYGGIRGRPGVTAMAAGPKKGSEKPIDIAELHNRLVAKQGETAVQNFTSEFRETTAFNCKSEPFSTEDSDGCMSSSFVSILSVSNGTVFVFYDKLRDGFGPAKSDGGSAVHAIRLSLNETKEEKEHEVKLEQQKLEAEREKAREEARRKAQKEAEERKRKQRREKIRQDKARRAEFNLKDQQYIDEALRFSNIDNEMIVVRDVDPDTVDIEKDTFFF